jgi:DNA replication protein DnaC
MTELKDILHTIRAETGTASCLDDRDEVLKEEIERQRLEYKSKQAERLWLESNVGKRFEHATFDSYTGDSGALKVCRDWAEICEEGTGLVLCGSYGVGKTHLAVACMRKVMELYGVTIYFNTFAGMLHELKSAYGKPEAYSRAMAKYKQVDLLVIDDLGKENMTEWGREILFNVIDERYRNMKSLIITTNLMPTDLGKHIDEAIMSRLGQMCKFVKVTGDDYRLRGKK